MPFSSVSYVKISNNLYLEKDQKAPNDVSRLLPRDQPAREPSGPLAVWKGDDFPSIFLISQLPMPNARQAPTKAPTPQRL